jgi:hypothetical protein
VAEKKKSLIAQARALFEAQPELFSDVPRGVDKTKPPVECSGERLFKWKPKLYADIVKAMAQPWCSQRWTCETFHISPHTYRAVRARENVAIATLKKEILADLVHLSKLSAERAIELMPGASCKDSLIGLGIAVDKLQLLSGDATTRVEHVNPEPHFNGEAEFKRFLDELLDEKQANARVIEQGAEPGDAGMGLCAPGKFPKSAAAAPLLPGDAETNEAEVERDPLPPLESAAFAPGTADSVDPSEARPPPARRHGKRPGSVVNPGAAVPDGVGKDDAVGVARGPAELQAGELWGRRGRSG